MSRLLLSTTVIVGAVLLVRALGPRMKDRASDACERMMDNMPDHFPPKQFMGRLANIEEQNQRILRILEQSGAGEEGDADEEESPDLVGAAPA